MEKENGWIKLHRKITEWEWYDDGNTFRLFVHLLLTATHSPISYKGKLLKRGQRSTSIRKLASELSVDEKTIQRCLRNLETTKEIKVETMKIGTLVTIRKYDDYQNIDIEDVGFIPTPAPTPTPTPCHTPPPTQNKNDKNDKNINILVELSEDNSLSDSDGMPTEQEKPQGEDRINYDSLVDYFNNKTCGVFGMLRKPLSEKRKKLIRARIREHSNEEFVEMIDIAMKSDFLKGKNQRNWSATFDWLILPSNFEKVLSGNYTNRTESNQKTAGRDIIGSEFSND